MSNLSIFEFEQQEVRFVGTSDKPEWIAKDICNILGIADPKSTLRHFSEDEKGVRSMPTHGGVQTLLTVYESGLYRLIFCSRKPQAEAFRRWIFHEVLPSIRKSGKYESPKSALNPHGRRPFVETHHVSLGQLKVYCLLKDLDRWMTAQEVAEACGIGKSSAARQCLYLQRAGIFDMIEVCPMHRYRFSQTAEQRNPATYHRFETALEAVGNPLHKFQLVP